MWKKAMRNAFFFLFLTKNANVKCDFSFFIAFLTHFNFFSFLKIEKKKNSGEQASKKPKKKKNRWKANFKNNARDLLRQTFFFFYLALSRVVNLIS